MGNILHMDTDQVRDLERVLSQMCDKFDQENSALSERCQSGLWEGQAREKFISEIFQLNRRMQDISSKSKDLVKRIEQEVLQWEETAGQVSLGGSTGTLPPIPPGGTIPDPIDTKHPDIILLEKQKAELQAQYEAKKAERDKLSAELTRLGEEMNKIDGFADAMKMLGIDIKNQSLSGAGGISTLIGLITASASALAAPIAALLATTFDLGKSIGLLNRMNEVAAKSEALSNEMIGISKQVIKINNEIGFYNDLKTLPGQ